MALDAQSPLAILDEATLDFPPSGAGAAFRRIRAFLAAAPRSPTVDRYVTGYDGR